MMPTRKSKNELLLSKDYKKYKPIEKHRPFLEIPLTKYRVLNAHRMNRNRLKLVISTNLIPEACLSVMGNAQNNPNKNKSNTNQSHPQHLLRPQLKQSQKILLN